MLMIGRVHVGHWDLHYIQIIILVILLLFGSFTQVEFLNVVCD